MFSMRLKPMIEGSVSVGMAVRCMLGAGNRLYTETLKGEPLGLSAAISEAVVKENQLTAAAVMLGICLEVDDTGCLFHVIVPRIWVAADFIPASVQEQNIFGEDNAA